MKKAIRITAVLFLLISTITFGQEAKKKKTEEIKIKTSAVCDMCKTTLEKAMAYEKGVKKSNLDVESKILTVTYNPSKTTPENIRKAISDAGYDADDVPANNKAYDKLNACCKKDAHKKE